MHIYEYRYIYLYVYVHTHVYIKVGLVCIHLDVFKTEDRNSSEEKYQCICEIVNYYLQWDDISSIPEKSLVHMTSWRGNRLIIYKQLLDCLHIEQSLSLFSDRNAIPL